MGLVLALLAGGGYGVTTAYCRRNFGWPALLASSAVYLCCVALLVWMSQVDPSARVVAFVLGTAVTYALSDLRWRRDERESQARR